MSDASAFHLPMRQPIDVFVTEMKASIQRSKAFEQKRLGGYAVNGGTKCAHGCIYCSSNALLRMHPSFKEAGRSSQASGFSIVDPTAPDRVRSHAKTQRTRGMVIVSTLVDSWAPDALRFNVGRQFLDAILSQPGWTVRILTKGAAVSKDLDLVKQHRDRVLVGLSVTATPDRDDLVTVLEPNTALISKRLSVMEQAASLGLRTYGMLCPLFPGIGDAPRQLDEMVRFYASIGAEEIFIEPVNARGKALPDCEKALRAAGYITEADSVGKIRKRTDWSAYTLALLRNAQESMRSLFDISKLRFLLYPTDLTPTDLASIRSDDGGVVWLGNH